VLQFKETSLNYFLEVIFPYDEKTIKFIKGIPGSYYQPQKKSWVVPVEFREEICKVWARASMGGERPNMVQHSFTMDKLASILTDTWPKLFEYQREGILRAVNTRRHFFTDETGLGKTAQAISAIRALGIRTCLVVCPAIVRYEWRTQFGKWWPNHPDIGIIEEGFVRKVTKKVAERRQKAYASPIRVVSYDLLSEVLDAKVEAIIFDEAHYLKSPASQQYQKAVLLTGNNPFCTLFGLSATIIPDRPSDVFGPLNLFYPGRYGRLNSNKKGSFTFNNRYSIATVKNPDYPPTFSGVNRIYAPELKMRLSFVSSRTTKEAVKHLLPPFRTQLLTIPNKQINQEAPNWGWFCEKNLTTKQNWVVDWFRNRVNEGVKRVTIFTHTRAAAEAYFMAITKEIPSWFGCCIHGDMPPDKRVEAIKHFNEAPMAFISATMHSLGIGINGLESSDQVLFAEMYWRPETNIQALGRFYRLSGRNPVTVSFLALENSIDMIVAEKVRQKVEAIGNLQDLGVAENAILTSLGQEKTDEEMFLELQKNFLAGSLE